MNHSPSYYSEEEEIAPAPGSTDTSKTDPKQLLLPTKVNVFASNETESKNHGIAYEAFPRGQLARWTAQPVLDWIESLAAATEANDRRGPMCVGTIMLSQPVPPLPAGAVPQQDEKSQAILPNHDDIYLQPRLWDISYITQNDPMAGSYTQQIKGLAVQLEELVGPLHPNELIDTQVIPTKASEQLMAAYRLLQMRVEFTFGRILGQQHQSSHGIRRGNGIDTEDETRKLLNFLYQETIAKLQSFITEYHQQPGDNLVSASGKLSTILPTVQFPDNASKIKPLSKQNFTKYMTNWLRDNWTNPYPDDQNLTEMAAHCGTTVQVIGNWLINARTRKWRPAIVKATALGRPADLLLEDSIRIFDGKPVRDLGDNHPTPPRHSAQTPQQWMSPAPSPQHNDMSMDDEDDDPDLVHEQEYQGGAPYSKRFRSSY